MLSHIALRPPHAGPLGHRATADHETAPHAPGNSSGTPSGASQPRTRAQGRTRAATSPDTPTTNGSSPHPACQRRWEDAPRPAIDGRRRGTAEHGTSPGNMWYPIGATGEPGELRQPPVRGALAPAAAPPRHATGKRRGPRGGHQPGNLGHRHHRAPCSRRMETCAREPPSGFSWGRSPPTSITVAIADVCSWSHYIPIHGAADCAPCTR